MAHLMERHITYQVYRSALYRMIHGLCLICLAGTSLLALEADIRVTRFQAGERAYIEMFVYVLGSSVQFKKQGASFHASVGVTYFMESGGEILRGDKFNLLSAGEDGIPDFMDMRRIALNPGDYELKVELVDNLDTANAVILSKKFTIRSPENALAQSDIQLLAKIESTDEEGVWVRNGKRMTPLPYDWYRPDQKNLIFYHELYHSDINPGADFYISYSIAPDFEADNHLLEGYKRLKPKPVHSIVQAVDISGLTSGEYFLEVNVFNQEKTLLMTRRKLFSRSNPVADQRMAQQGDRFFDNSFTLGMSYDSVRYALKAIAPVIAQTQVPVLNYLLQKGELSNQRRFLHQYWIDKDPVNPAQAYIEYMKFAVAVDREYHAAFGHGFETDRGRMLLKYGMPSDIISVSDEPSAPPYEIWIYNAFPVTNQSNVRFLFYNPSLAGGDFRLLHSTAIGELQNRRWQQVLYGDALSESGAGDFIDARDVQDNFQRRAVEYFNE